MFDHDEEKKPHAHLQELQALLDVLDLLLVALDHGLHLLAVGLGVNRVRDVGRGRGHAAGRGHADAHRGYDERGAGGEGRQDEASDGGDGAGHAGHAPPHAGRHRLLVEVVGGVGQLQQLQDALLQGAAALVEEAHEEAGRHEDAVSGLLHHPDQRRGKNTGLGDELPLRKTLNNKSMKMSQIFKEKKKNNKMFTHQRHRPGWTPATAAILDTTSMVHTCKTHSIIRLQIKKKKLIIYLQLFSTRPEDLLHPEYEIKIH